MEELTNSKSISFVQQEPLLGQEKIVFMQNNKTENDSRQNSAAPWFVMIHMNPSWIETMLQKDSSGQLQTSEAEPLPPYRFYIPYLYMPHITVTHQLDSQFTDKHYVPAEDKNGLRSDLHGFVFIQAPAERVESIVKAEWNVRSRLRLYHYRDTNGEKVTIPDAEMHCFIKALQDHHLKFFLDQPIDDFSVGDKVILQMEPWVGKMAEIREVKVRKDRTSITVSMNIFNRMKSINFPDVSYGDVKFVDEEKGRLLSGNPITNYEEEIIDLLSHRYCQKFSEDVAEGDRQRLKRLASYSHIYAEDAYEQARFAALKLICAYLLQSASKREACLQKVTSLLGDKQVPETNAEAYLMIALFITTRQAHWRTAVKEYRNTHTDCPDIFRRFHTITKEFKAKKK